MLQKRNIKVGKVRKKFFILINIFSIIFFLKISHANILEGNYTNIKILDKISSKNILIKLKNGEEILHKDLSIKSMKCKNSEFDDDPEITSYLQVRDLNNKDNNEVFVFNGWTFSSSPSIQVFDHPVYDLWILKCY